MAASIEPTKVDFNVYQGATWKRRVTFWAGEPLALVNLTGYTARLQLRTIHGATTAKLTLTDSSGITLNGSQGTIDLVMTNVQTESLISTGSVPVQYVYDLRLVTGSGETIRLIEGKMTVWPRVTAAT